MQDRESRPRLVRTLVRLSFVPILASVVAGCFYDSRWGEREKEQRRNAARAAPSALRGEPSAPEAAGGPEVGPAAQPRAFRIRIYVTPQYASQVLDAREQVRDMVADANRILGPTVRARLDVESVLVWQAPGAGVEDTLLASLAAIQAKDAGNDVDWVVAMVGGVPKVTASFHEIGMSRVLGKHLVMRPSSALGEHDAINKAFDELADDERSRLRRALKRHRASAVFLHEVGHTLGALHETDVHSIMHPTYDPAMTAFGPDAARLMRLTVDHRAEPVPNDARALADDLLGYLDASPCSAWVPGERDALAARLRAETATRGDGVIPPPPAPVSAQGGAGATPRAEIEGVKVADQDALARTADALAKGDPAKAWEAGRALFTAYPDVIYVQDLRCQVAMRGQASFEYTRSECARLMELSTSPPKKKNVKR